MKRRARVQFCHSPSIRASFNSAGHDFRPNCPPVAGSQNGRGAEYRADSKRRKGPPRSRPRVADTSADGHNKHGAGDITDMTVWDEFLTAQPRVKRPIC